MNNFTFKHQISAQRQSPTMDHDHLISRNLKIHKLDLWRPEQMQRRFLRLPKSNASCSFDMHSADCNRQHSPEMAHFPTHSSNNGPSLAHSDDATNSTFHLSDPSPNTSLSATSSAPVQSTKPTLLHRRATKCAKLRRPRPPSHSGLCHVCFA